MSVETVSHQFAPSAEEILIARENEQDAQRKLELLKEAVSSAWRSRPRVDRSSVLWKHLHAGVFTANLCIAQHDCQTPQSYFAHAEKIFREFLILRVFTGHFFLEYSVEKIFSLSLVDFSLCSPPREWWEGAARLCVTAIGSYTPTRAGGRGKTRAARISFLSP